jgi:hypothetical protein
MTEKTIWVSFDLGIKGDYQGIYSWLDRYGAKECSNSLAALKFNIKENLIEEIEKEIKVSVKLKEEDRVYIIWKDDENGKIKGRFINGGRKRAPWQGFGQSYSPQIEDE